MARAANAAINLVKDIIGWAVIAVVVAAGTAVALALTAVEVALPYKVGR